MLEVRGDAPGHPFRGNQHVDAEGGGGAEATASFETEPSTEWHKAHPGYKMADGRFDQRRWLRDEEAASAARRAARAERGEPLFKPKTPHEEASHVVRKAWKEKVLRGPTACTGEGCAVPIRPDPDVPERWTHRKEGAPREDEPHFAWPKGEPQPPIKAGFQPGFRHRDEVTRRRKAVRNLMATAIGVMGKDEEPEEPDEVEKVTTMEPEIRSVKPLNHERLDHGLDFGMEVVVTDHLAAVGLREGDRGIVRNFTSHGNAGDLAQVQVGGAFFHVPVYALGLETREAPPPPAAPSVEMVGFTNLGGGAVQGKYQDPGYVGGYATGKGSTAMATFLARGTKHVIKGKMSERDARKAADHFNGKCSMVSGKHDHSPETEKMVAALEAKFEAEGTPEWAESPEAAAHQVALSKKGW